ncbi:MAG TPA: hypothetical protein VEZ11_15510 [Thermoanaerobaculia bacterium]|nr:hypothetical protein [Thermoanaerobaculia bacterium]
MSLKIRGGVLFLLGLGGLAAAVQIARFRFLGIVVAVAFFFLSATALSKAGEIAHTLRSFVMQAVRVEVWGRPLQGPEETFEIDSISAISAGLHIRLRPTSGGSPRRLKVAQPKSTTVEQGRIEIGQAAYVSWAGTKIKPDLGPRLPALVMLFVPGASHQVQVG